MDWDFSRSVDNVGCTNKLSGNVMENSERLCYGSYSCFLQHSACFRAENYSILL